MAFEHRRRSTPRVLAIVLAGGEGRRLLPLTADRAKPAVPIGGRYRLIDFVLSNLVNSGILKVKVLTQYKSDSLNVHLSRGWHLPSSLDVFIDSVPAQQRTGKSWFQGSADAIFQSMNHITDEQPEHVVVFSADHLYRMDVQQMLDFHIESGADMTVAAIPVPVKEARDFGVLAADAAGRMTAFVEKPQVPPEMVDRPGFAFASMGNYIWRTEALIEEIHRDASAEGGSHDFGKNILPSLIDRLKVSVYDFDKNEIPGQEDRERGYWRDVGTIEAYFDANMDLVSVHPIFNLYNHRWPIRTWAQPFPPAKFVFADEETARMGIATDSLVSEGCIVSGGRIDRSVLSPAVRVNSYAHVEESILFEGVEVGRNAKIRRAIVDKNVHVPERYEIGFDHAADRAAGLTVLDDHDLVVVPKGHKFG